MMSTQKKSVWKFRVAALSVVSLLLVPMQFAVGGTVCEIVRPNSNVNTLWETYSYTNIDDYVEKPSTPSSDSVEAGSSDDYEEQIWGFDVMSASNIVSVTAVHANIHAADGHVTGDHPSVRIKAGGVWSATQTAELEDGWYTLIFYDVWSATDIDSLQLGINPRLVNNSEDIILDAIYCEVCGSTSP